MSLGPSAEELKVQLVSEERYLEERIAHVERNFSALATDLGGAVRRTARLRDKGDRLVKTLQDFASTEMGTMRKSLDGLAECLSALENCQQLKIDRMEAKVVKPLLEYDGVCRKAREELRTSHSVREKEVNKQRNLDRVRIRDPANRKRIFESDLQKVKIERLRSAKTLEEYMEVFERKKTQDFRMIEQSLAQSLHTGSGHKTMVLLPTEIVSEFIHTQLAFHAKALELYTLAYQHTQAISEEEAVEQFHKNLHPRKQGAAGYTPHYTPETPSLTPSHTNLQTS